MKHGGIESFLQQFSHPPLRRYQGIDLRCLAIEVVSNSALARKRKLGNLDTADFGWVYCWVANANGDRATISSTTVSACATHPRNRGSTVPKGAEAHEAG